MARPSKQNKKDVYERIEEQKNKIREIEELLAQQNEELKELLKEQDNLEMVRMLEAVRSQGIDIETALAKLLSDKTNK